MPAHQFLLFLLGLLVGAAGVALLLLPRLRSATVALRAETAHAREKIALVAGNCWARNWTASACRCASDNIDYSPIRPADG